MAHHWGDVLTLILEEHIELQISVGAVALLADTVADGHMCTVVVDAEDWLELLREYHDAPLVGHFGVTKMYAALLCNYIWCGIKHDVADYVQSFKLCAQSKADQHAPYGLLCLLPVPQCP